jgi:hypothetical protein
MWMRILTAFLMNMLDAVVRLGEPYSTGDGRIPRYLQWQPMIFTGLITPGRHWKTRGLPKDALEFQMLYGIRRICRNYW